MLEQAQGVFQFFNKPGQKGQGQGQGSRRTPQATTAQEEEARASNADWGDQQVCSASFDTSDPALFLSDGIIFAHQVA